MPAWGRLQGARGHGVDRGKAGKRIIKPQDLKILGNSLGMEPETGAQIQVLPLPFSPALSKSDQ